MSKSPTDPVIVTRGLSKSYRSRLAGSGFRGVVQALTSPVYETYQALTDLSVSIYPGEILGFLGPNGAGKSTFIKLLTGIQTPSSGEVRILGFTPGERQPNFLQQIGVVFGHKSSLWWDLSVRHNFASISRIYGLSPDQLQASLSQLVPALGIGAILDRPIRVLSLGERVKCEVAAALLHGPRLLFLDEPTVGLDITSRSELREQLKYFATQRGTSIVLTSHDVGDIETCCSRVLLVNKGSIAFDGDIGRLKAGFGESCKLHIKMDDRPLAAEEIVAIRHLLQPLLETPEALDVADGGLVATLHRSKSREAVVLLAALDTQVSVEIRHPALEEILLQRFRSFQEGATP